MKKNVLLIGASGGIAQALIKQFINDASLEHLVTVSRQALEPLSANHEHILIDSTDETQIKAFVDQQKTKFQFTQIVCCTGVLHTSGNQTLKPEKRLEDMNLAQFEEYFKVNTVVPALWLKYAVHLVDKAHAVITVFSARVGSISENQLGGWYGYRASKAALNMIVKTAAVEYKRRAPNTVLVSYHPGTVDTELSKPFQSNVKASKLFTPEFTAQKLILHTSNLDPEGSPYYLDWDGKTINW
ncbi:SDR family NAD(P)-dependent oxidoreductase [Glaciecola sp. XM2]|jgi:NAD(P)-dependent dehydrogenase (short-subunit alcohol dehydrogenase family)|uniref:SDR family NAD(P)-dependent oxidoreductase n=1 Tax=Glaciecola sp. XM2 TaxID=1914931 RepID=UPI001BDE2E64|nr:SDR family NAD(P)-dependent oxidoreductase [Glaciecola sp. XM2]MBT1451122.1 SDR family NAD(P)-dependent oxidoreductase [Glaciecola sp. XM2]